MLVATEDDIAARDTIIPDNISGLKKEGIVTRKYHHNFLTSQGLKVQSPEVRYSSGRQCRHGYNKLPP
eukprot:14842701-Ditylum_brightwellii.AAC.1